MTSGPYSIVRHPIYTAMLGLLIATGIVLSHWAVVVIALVIFLIANFGLTGAWFAGGIEWNLGAEIAQANLFKKEQVVIGHPDRHVALDRVQLNRRGPTLRFNTAPGIRKNPDGTEEPMGDILHMYTTRR